MYFEWVIRVFRLPENGGCNKKDKRKCPRQPENANLPFCAVLGARMAERWQVGAGQGKGVFSGRHDVREGEIVADYLYGAFFQCDFSNARFAQ